MRHPTGHLLLLGWWCDEIDNAAANEEQAEEHEPNPSDVPAE